jgi:hypothetical protein
VVQPEENLRSILLKFIILLVVLGGGACYVFFSRVRVPFGQNDVCELFSAHPGWYRATRAAKKKWFVPASLQMAIIHQESHFRPNVRPGSSILRFLGLGSSSSALGYAQALDPTWKSYLQHNHLSQANRSDFDSATDFIGWYVHRLHVGLGIPVSDSFRMYLAYHEGLSGFRNKRFNKKPWLMRVAKKVERQEKMYHKQLLNCLPAK